MRILSIDGGGVFGTIPAYFLSHVDLSVFDVYCGTSVGSILAISYACNKTGEEVFDLFNKNIKRIFKKKNFWILKGPEYDDSRLNEYLQLILPGTIKDLKRKIVVPTFDADENKPKIYENFTNQDEDENNWEVARKSCSAPSYFAPWKGFIDGGIVANNPSLVTIGTVLKKTKTVCPQIELFSIGTGIKFNYLGDGVEKWRRWNWILPMLKMLTNSNEIVTDFTLKLMPLKKYVRYNPIKLEKDWSFVNPNCVDSCLEKAKYYKNEFLIRYEEFLR